MATSIRRAKKIMKSVRMFYEVRETKYKSTNGEGIKVLTPKQMLQILPNEVTLHGKPYFLFPDALKRWSFQKNCAGTWSFL